MSSPMDKVPFANGQPSNFENVLRMAQNDPRSFEEQMKRMNPQGYQLAYQIRNSPNPRETILQLAQQRGINPNILRMLGL